MTPQALLHTLLPFKGIRIVDCIDDITQAADGYTVNVMDPNFNIGPIDNDTRRLNVRTDESGRVTSFTIG